MKRRDVLKTSSIILGYTITAGTAAAILNGCKADRSIDWTPQYLDAQQSLLIGDVSELIIPKTDTPGALDAKVDRFVDAMLGAWDSKERNNFIIGLKAFDEEATKQFKRGFTKCTPEQQKNVLDALVGEAQADTNHIFNKVKELTVLGYCSSEEGATSLLTYDPVPGPYEGCIDLSSVGATYAL